MSASGSFDLSRVNGLRAVAWLASVAGQSTDAVRAGLSRCGRIPAERAASLAEQGRALAQQHGSVGLRDATGDLEEVAAWLLADAGSAQWVRELRAALSGCPATSEERLAVAVLARGLPVQPADAEPEARSQPVGAAVSIAPAHPPQPPAHVPVQATAESSASPQPALAVPELDLSQPAGSGGFTLELEDEVEELSFPLPDGMPPDASDLERQFIVRFAQDLARQTTDGPELDLGGGESADRA